VNVRSPMALTMLFVIAVLTGLGSGYVWYWNRLADGLRDGVAIWLGQRRAEGMVAQSSAPDISGFPFAIDAAIARLDLGQGARDQPDYWLWSGRKIRLRINPQQPWRIFFSTSTPQRTEFRDARGSLRNLQAVAGLASGTVDIANNGQAANMDANIQALALTGSALAGPVQVGRIQARAGFLQQTDFDIQGHKVLLPPDINAVFGEQVDVFRLKATIKGHLPRAWNRDAVTTWRDQGGNVDLTRARLKWGDLDMTAIGTLALDSLMRPQGSGTASIRGHNESIRSLADRRLITPLNAAALTIGLNMLGQENNGTIKVPVSARGGQLKIGNISSLRLQPLKFPGD
jgi:hypothetical protein